MGAAAPRDAGSPPGPPIWVLAGPSGSGKTTLANALVDRSGGLVRRARTCTTREPRPGEVSGVDYTFVSAEEFQRLADSGALVEETTYGGNRYGVPVSEIPPDREVLVVVDPPGIRHLRSRFGGARVVAICLSGYSETDLAARLVGRGADPGEIEARLRNLAAEAAALDGVCDFRVAPGAPEDVLGAVEELMRRVRGRSSRPL
ncbi:MAG: 50S ribosome-binding GTPase [Candidatus Sericytochromatia bacterium]|nr:50S ribosome-binding GTPase [Candidatus Tanganyikabacteria bacterium]